MERRITLKVCHHVLNMMRCCGTVSASGSIVPRLSTAGTPNTNRLPKKSKVLFVSNSVFLRSSTSSCLYHSQRPTGLESSSSFSTVHKINVGRGSAVLNPRRTMAGHSKWQNIRHIKAAKDEAKARLIADISQRARAIFKETGNPDPKSNLRLARLIAEAKSKDVPNANIDKILSQMNKMKNAAPTIFEAKGPSGSVMLIEAMADKVTKMRADLQGIVRKCGFSMFEGGSLAMLSFMEKGIVMVDVGKKEGEEAVDLDHYIDIAIEVGAEEVTLEDGPGEQVLQFLCEPGEVYAVQKELQARELPVRSAEVTFLTTNTVNFPPQDIEKLSKVLDKLDDHPDVLKVYTNVAETDSAIN